MSHDFMNGSSFLSVDSQCHPIVLERPFAPYDDVTESHRPQSHPAPGPMRAAQSQPDPQQHAEHDAELSAGRYLVLSAL